MGNPNFQTGLFPHRVRPCAAMKSPSHSGRGSRPSCRTVLITAKQAIPLTIFDRSSMASSGSSIPAPHGVTSRNVTVPGRRSSGASTGGGRTALGAVSSPRCWTNWTTKGRSITTSGVSMAPSSGPARRRRGRKKTRAAPSNWAGQRRRKCKSRLTMRWDVPGAGLARRSIWSVTATVSSSQSISPPDKRMRAKCSSPRWPVGCFSAAAAKVDGHDKSQPTRGTAIRIRQWCRRRRIEAVIPTRANQPQNKHFNKATYRQRHIVEQVVGWYKEYRALDTRYEKLAVNYVALWLVAIMDKALHRLFPNTA